MTIEWGSVADWTTAGLALGALFSAVWAGRAASGQLTELKKEGQFRDQQEEQAQAAQVAVWLDRDQSGEFLAMYVNTSSLPIYEATVGFSYPRLSEPQLVRHRVLPPSAESALMPAVTGIVMQAAANDSSVEASWVTNHESVAPLQTILTGQGERHEPEASVMIGPIGLSITFTDTENRRWNRDISGRLIQVDPGFEIVRSGLIV